jgi:hypothetical protein
MVDGGAGRGGILEVGVEAILVLVLFLQVKLRDGHRGGSSKLEGGRQWSWRGLLLIVFAWLVSL